MNWAATSGTSSTASASPLSMGRAAASGTSSTASASPLSMGRAAASGTSLCRALRSLQRETAPEMSMNCRVPTTARIRIGTS